MWKGCIDVVWGTELTPPSCSHAECWAVDQKQQPGVGGEWVAKPLQIPFLVWGVARQRGRNVVVVKAYRAHSSAPHLEATATRGHLTKPISRGDCRGTLSQTSGIGCSCELIKAKERGMEPALWGNMPLCKDGSFLPQISIMPPV